MVSLRRDHPSELGEADHDPNRDGGVRGQRARRVACVGVVGCGARVEVDRRLLRFAFYGRYSTEDRQNPTTSLAWQRDQAEATVTGGGPDR